MTQLTIDKEVSGAFTAASQNAEFNVANRKDFGDKRLDLEGTFSASGTFGGGTLLLQGWDGAQWNDIETLSSAGTVRVGPYSALNYRAFLSGGNSPNVSWFLNSELWFESSMPLPPSSSEAWDSQKAGIGINLSNENLTATLALASNDNKGLMAVNGVSSGKYYWEVTCDIVHMAIGVAHADWATHLNDTSPIPSWNSNFFGYNSSNGKLLHGETAYGSSYSFGDVVGVALDLDSHKVWFSKNGVWQSGDPAAGTNPAYSSMPPDMGLYYPAVSLQSFDTTARCIAKFGGSAFTYPIPSGFTPGVPG